MPLSISRTFLLPCLRKKEEKHCDKIPFPSTRKTAFSLSISRMRGEDFQKIQSLGGIWQSRRGYMICDPLCYTSAYFFFLSRPFAYICTHIGERRKSIFEFMASTRPPRKIRRLSPTTHVKKKTRKTRVFRRLLISNTKASNALPYKESRKKKKTTLDGSPKNAEYLELSDRTGFHLLLIREKETNSHREKMRRRESDDVWAHPRTQPLSSMRG